MAALSTVDNTLRDLCQLVVLVKAIPHGLRMCTDIGREGSDCIG